TRADADGDGRHQQWDGMGRTRGRYAERAEQCEPISRRDLHGGPTDLLRGQRRAVREPDSGLRYAAIGDERLAGDGERGTPGGTATDPDDGQRIGRHPGGESGATGRAGPFGPAKGPECGQFDDHAVSRYLAGP